MRTSSAKAKGRRFQQWVRDYLIDKFSLTDDDVRSATMGETGADLILSAAGRKVFPYAVECKNQEIYTKLYRDFAQASNNTGKHRLTPLLMIKMNRRKPLVVMDFDDFMKLIP